MSLAATKPPLMVTLSPCECEALSLYAEGMSTKEIARATDRSPDTIKDRLHIARLKLSARDTTHAVAIAIRHGLIA